MPTRTLKHVVAKLPSKNRAKVKARTRELVSEHIRVTRSSGNIYADLGLPDAEELRVKAGVVVAIDHAIKLHKLTQTAAAERTGIAQPDLSKILRGRFSGVSLWKLLEAAAKLGIDVKIGMTAMRRARRGKICLVGA